MTAPADAARPARVLVIDPHPLLRAAVRGVFAPEPGLAVCGEAATAADGVRLCRELAPDLVLLEPDLPDAAGREGPAKLLSELRSLAGPPKVLVLTGSFTPKAAADAMRRGASGVMSKREAPAELARVAAEIARGNAYLGPELLAYLARRRKRRR